MNSFSEGFTCSLQSPHQHFMIGSSILWRDLSPAVDIEIEKILNNNCSQSMIRECRPSLKSSVFALLAYGTFVWKMIM